MAWSGRAGSRCTFTDDRTEFDGEHREWECPHGALEGRAHCPFHCRPEDVPDSVDVSEAFLGGFFVALYVFALTRSVSR